MQVFYVNVGGGEPTVRPDFWHLLDYAVGHDVGVKFSTNGIKLDRARARAAGPHRLRRRADLAGRRDGRGERRRARGGLLRHRDAGAGEPGRGRDGGRQGLRRVTRENAGQLDEFRALTDRYGAQLRITRLPALRPRRGRLGPAAPDPGQQQRELYAWLLANGDRVLTGDSFFHLSALGEALPGLNLCGAGRVVCLIDPVGDVYACPFAIHENFLAGNVRDEGGFQRVWRESELFADLRSPQTGGACTKCAHFDACRGGCMAAKFFTGLPLDGPDPECVQGYGETALAARDTWSWPRRAAPSTTRTAGPCAVSPRCWACRPCRRPRHRQGLRRVTAGRLPGRLSPLWGQPAPEPRGIRRRCRWVDRDEPTAGRGGAGLLPEGRLLPGGRLAAAAPGHRPARACSAAAALVFFAWAARLRPARRGRRARGRGRARRPRRHCPRLGRKAAGRGRHREPDGGAARRSCTCGAGSPSRTSASS